MNGSTSESVGVAAALCASLLWAWGSARFMPLVAKHGPFALNLFKAVVGAALFWSTCAVLGVTGSDVLAGCGSDETVWLVVSGIIGLAAGDYCFLASVDRVGVRQATLLHGTAPLWLLLLNLVGVGQALGAMQVVGILLVVGGVLDVTRRRTERLGGVDRAKSGLLLGLLAALGQAVGIQIAKAPTVACESVVLVSAVRLTGAMAGLLVIAVLTRQMASFAGLLRDRKSRVRSIEPVLLGTFLGVLCMTLAIDAAHEAVAGALLSLTPVFAVPVSRWLHGDPVHWQTLIGTCIAALGVALISMG